MRTLYQTPFMTNSFINSLLQEMKILQKPASVAVVSSMPPRPRHRLPSMDVHAKINVGAAVLQTGGRGAMAAMCKNQAGIYQGASVVVITHIDDPTTLETLAIREALALAEDLYITRIAVASDCKVAVEAIKREAQHHMEQRYMKS